MQLDVSSQTPGDETLLTMYRTMTLARACEARLRKGFGSGEFAGVIWPSRGQEAIAGGLSTALRRDDRLVTTYRGIHDLLAKGVPPAEIMGEVLGRGAGASRGKGGTMHITCPEVGVMLSTGIVGSGPPVAVGLALAARLQGSDRVVAVCFGDGATNTGSFHEAVNLAAVWDLPLVLICQNNQYAELTPVEETMRVERIADRAAAYAIPGIRVDGNDPVAVHNALSAAVGRARSGAGPTLVECLTFRYGGHYVGDPQVYMAKDRLEQAMRGDPFPRYERFLIEHGVADADRLAALDAASVAEIDEAITVVLDSPEASLGELEADIYADLAGVPR
ncbi:thiamine pyrophosphate-dependent dehydrogenase E1 component subunit alpha [Streptomyces fuscichromogenes]|uniref:Pyruvate dehydrogenase E1 component subunit alpha n=1 Tax=Streptomyces fuscichromogenes TaxID=1324013 RepID=A0A918CPE7_9ACTN|nr:thiamine pyrophosphate-dependent dehydrogenase E1 component subunit alpha [Streptomyces fuscichromogenes]GGM98338.1 pyruvate dehydrogenase E1 component subunit alpha [Streptomyces fuscichromogenes]